MEPIEQIALVLRWLHILAGMTAVGGMIFLRLVLVPSLGVLSAGDSRALHDQMRRRWSKTVAAAIGLLLVTGLVNYFILRHLYVLPKWYHMLWGVKFLIALGVFFISSVLSGRSALAEKFRGNMRLWLNLNIALAIIIVCLSGVLKSAKRVEKTTLPPTAAVGLFEEGRPV